MVALRALATLAALSGWTFALWSLRVAGDAHRAMRPRAYPGLRKTRGAL